MSRVLDWELEHAKSIIAKAQKEKKRFVQTYVNLLESFMQSQAKGDISLRRDGKNDLQITFWSEETSSVDIYTFSDDATIKRQAGELVKYFKGKPFDRDKLDTIYPRLVYPF